MFSLRRPAPPSDLLTSKLLDENTFYSSFIKDLSRCMNEVIIESPFITSNRMALLLPVFRRLTNRGIKVTVNTRHPAEHDEPFSNQALDAIAALQSMGVQVLFTGSHHRKLVILDRRIFYEGSLNVLSQNDSSEIMRRVESEELAQQLLRFIKLDRFLR